MVLAMELRRCAIGNYLTPLKRNHFISFSIFSFHSLPILANCLEGESRGISASCEIRPFEHSNLSDEKLFWPARVPRRQIHFGHQYQTELKDKHLRIVDSCQNRYYSFKAEEQMKIRNSGISFICISIKRNRLEMG